MQHKGIEVSNDGYRVHPLPEQVRSVTHDTDVRGVCTLDELADPGRVEDEVLRMELECHLNVKVSCLAVYLPPELLGERPLMIKDI